MVAAAIALVGVVAARHVLAIIALFVAGAVGIWDLVDVTRLIEENSGEGFRASAGWGLYIVAIGSVIGFFATIAERKRARSSS